MTVRHPRSIGVGLLFALFLVGCDDEAPPIYSDDEIAYFTEVAFGTEGGDPGDTLVVRKWREDVRVRIDGFPSERQVETVRNVARELVDLTGGIDIAILERGSNGVSRAEILFVTQDSMAALVGATAAGNVGIFQYWWDGDDVIYKGRVIIAYDRGTEAWLDHLIREELTQLLGLGRDSWSYAESIFYEGPSEVSAFLPIDRSVIRMLYDRRLSAGMPRADALRILSGT